MRACTQSELDTLKRIGLVNHYYDNQFEYDGLLNDIYSSLPQPPRPDDDELLRRLTTDLKAYSTFLTFLSSNASQTNHIKIDFYPVYAEDLARFIVNATSPNRKLGP